MKKENTLKNKRVVVVFLVCLLAVGGTIWITSEKDGSPTGEVKAGLDPASFLKDSSGDGMYDWEKSLWGLDPLKNDFSGDGIPDVEKIKMGRDPRFVYPDDELKDWNMPAYMKTYENPTKTEALIEDYWQNFRKLAESNKMTDEELNSMMQGLMEKHTSDENSIGRITRSHYRFADIETVPNTRETLYKYGNEVGHLLKKYSDQVEFNEIILIQQAIKTGDQSLLEKTEENISLYKEGVKDLLKIKVPEGLEVDHLKVTNALVRMRNDIHQIKSNAIDDPLASIINMDYYQKNLIEYAVVARSVQEHLFSAGIEYAPDEPGYFFMEFNFGVEE